MAKIIRTDMAPTYTINWTPAMNSARSRTNIAATPRKVTIKNNAARKRSLSCTTAMALTTITTAIAQNAKSVTNEVSVPSIID